MKHDSKDELINTQNIVIGILFEIIKIFQNNNDLDEKYFEMLKKNSIDQNKLTEILKKRNENGKYIMKLLDKL